MYKQLILGDWIVHTFSQFHMLMSLQIYYRLSQCPDRLQNIFLKYLITGSLSYWHLLFTFYGGGRVGCVSLGRGNLLILEVAIHIFDFKAANDQSNIKCHPHPEKSWSQN